jgi:hypothetical protein
MTGAILDEATLPEASAAEVRTLITRARSKGYRGGVIGVHAQARWSGPSQFEVDGAPVRVIPCVSALAVRAAVAEWDQDGWLVVLTDRGDADLGDGLLAHLVFQRLNRPSLWDAVRERFQARTLDALLVREPHQLAEALVAHAPPDGWPPVRGGLLTRDGAWSALTDRVLGLPPERVDALGLLEWTLDPVRVAALDRLPELVGSGLLDWLAERTGETGRCTVATIRAGHGSEAAALALAAGALAEEQADPVRAAEARGRLASRYGGKTPAGETARGWAETARALLERPSSDRRLGRELPAHAEALLAEGGAGDLAALSPVLPGGFTARLRHLARELEVAVRAVAAGRPADVGAVERAQVVITGHLLAELEPRRAAHAGMAVRLLRWLAAPSAEPTVTIADAIARQVRDDGWVDRARADVWAGDGEDDLAVTAAYYALYTAVTARRTDHDRQFAEFLAAHTRAGAGTGNLLQVEQVLDQVVLPLVRELPVLVVVVDAMSTAVAAELTEGLAADGWGECLPAGQRERSGVLAALPTVTEVCRTSLLCGAPARGGQAEEATGLAAWARRARRRAALFHKADLERSTAGGTLPTAVRDAVQDRGVDVVAVVLNTVDDALERSDPGRTAWDVDAITHLRPLLHQARVAGRAVVLTSDHGHVVERRVGELRGLDGVTTARWRPAGPEAVPVGDGEVEVGGPRVLLGGGRVVMAWREGLRYVPLRAGYHGGASAAEAVIPLSVHVYGASAQLSGEGGMPRGWEPAPPQAPAWWTGAPVPPAGTVTGPAKAAPRPRGHGAGGKRPVSTPTLFEPEGTTWSSAAEPAPAAPARDLDGGLTRAVLASQVYAGQRARARRAPLDDDKVAAMLGALLAAGGRLPQASLAAAAGVPEFRLPGVMSVLQRLLNVEGYEVVGYDPDGVTVVLDVGLLREQFNLDEPR